MTERDNLHVEAHGEIIIVTQPETAFYAIYEMRSAEPQLILKGRADTEDHVFLARVWHLAVEQSWVGSLGPLISPAAFHANQQESYKNQHGVHC